MTLLMIWEGSSNSSFVFFVFSFLFSCSYGTQINDHFIESKYDHLVFIFSCLSVLPSIVALRTLVVLGV
jgi:hypothetical protein